MKSKIKWGQPNPPKIVFEEMRWLFFITFILSLILGTQYSIFYPIGLLSLGVFFYGVVLYNQNPEVIKNRKDKWFSGWALFFWIILFWPGAIIYIVIKSTNKNNR